MEFTARWSKRFFTDAGRRKRGAETNEKASSKVFPVVAEKSGALDEEFEDASEDFTKLLEKIEYNDDLAAMVKEC